MSFACEQRLYQAELWRSLGDLVAAAGPKIHRGALPRGPLAARPDAATCYQRAAEIAREQGARLFEERAEAALKSMSAG